MSSPFERFGLFCPVFLCALWGYIFLTTPSSPNLSQKD
jgi:hypothetical protein